MTSKATGFLFLLGWAASAGSAPQADRSQSRTLRDPEQYSLFHSDVSRPLREMPVLPPIEEEGAWRLHPVKLIRPPRPVPRRWVDPLAEAGRAAAAAAPQVATTPGLSFDGVGVGLAGFTVTGAPPDTNGAVGATQYVQWVNTSFAVFNKSTGALVYGPAAGNSLWQGFGGACETTNSGDPVVMYDKAASRWVMTQFSINQSASQFFQCVAVSTTSDATGSYRRFAYSFPGFNDYPKGGVWPDGYYLTFNMFNAAGTAFTGARVCALDRNQMVTASGTPGPIQCFQLSTAYGGLLPSDLDGAPPLLRARPTTWWRSTTSVTTGSTSGSSTWTGRPRRAPRSPAPPRSRRRPSRRPVGAAPASRSRARRTSSTRWPTASCSAWPTATSAPTSPWS